MKSWVAAGMMLVLAGIIVSGCSGSQNEKPLSPGTSCPVTAHEKSDSTLPARIEGTVLQTLPAGRYVYAELDTGAGSVWVAAPQESVAKGDKVSCKPVTLMKKFDSPILKRTFDQVYFVESLTTPQVAGVLPANHPPIPVQHAGHGSALSSDGVEVKLDVTPAEGGVTIAGLVAGAEKLVGAEVLLRGKVTKYNAGIMGANWLHVKDGSDKRDLVVTTKSAVGLGNTVLVKGKLERNVDLGSGYAYDLIIRNADVTVEKPDKSLPGASVP